MEYQHKKPGLWKWEDPVANISHKLIDMVNRVTPNETNRERDGIVDLSRFDKQKRRKRSKK